MVLPSDVVRVQYGPSIISDSLSKIQEKSPLQDAIKNEPIPILSVGFKEFVEKNKIRADTLTKNVEFSQKLIDKAKSELSKILTKFNNKGISIILCGSFCRLEASSSSDADFFAIFEDNGLADEAIEAIMLTAKWFNKEKIDVHHLDELEKKLQKDAKEGFGKGRFPTLFPVDKLLSSYGNKEDSDEWRTRRMCILTEAVPVYNQSLFNEVKKTLADKYLLHLAPKTNRLPEVFLKEFKNWCAGLETAPWAREEVGELFRIKAEIIRKFVQNATLLAFNSCLIQGTEDAFNKQLSILDLPPILRLFYMINSLSTDLKDKTLEIIKQLIAIYNDSFKVLGDSTFREYLEKDSSSTEAKQIKITLNKNSFELSKLWDEISNFLGKGRILN